MKPRFRSRSGFPFPAGAIRAATWLLLGGLLLLGGAAFAQVQRKPVAIAMPVQAAITAVTPRSLSLMQAAPKAQVTVTGTNLVTIQAVQVVKGGQGVPAVSADLVQPWPASGKVVIMAGMAAPVGQGYQLRFSGKAGFKNFSFDLPPAMFSLEVTPRVVAQTQTSRPLEQARPIKTTNPFVLLQSSPDLIVDSIRIDPPNPDNGGLGFLVYATIKNRGGKEAFLPRGWNLAASEFSGWRPGNFYGFSPNENVTLAPGAAKEILVYNYRSAEKSPAGDWKVTVRADPDKQIAEAYENNNEKSVNLHVTDTHPPTGPPAALADLVITQLWFEPAETTLAGNFKLVAIVLNQGQTPAQLSNGYAILSEQGNHLACEGIWDVTLQPGQTMTFRCSPQRLERGTFTWTVRVDPMNKVEESDETNNTKTIQVTIQ